MACREAFAGGFALDVNFAAVTRGATLELGGAVGGFGTGGGGGGRLAAALLPLDIDEVFEPVDRAFCNSCLPCSINR